MSENSNQSKRVNPSEWDNLKAKIDGELFYDHGMRTIYSTDASSYRVMPEAVAMPKGSADRVEDQYNRGDLG